MRSSCIAARLLFVGGISLALGFAPCADAALITVNFSGTVGSVDPALAGTFTVGDTLTGSYTFDSTTSARGGSDSTFAVFDALTALSFSINGYAASSAGAPEIQVDNDPPAPDFDRYGVVARASDGLTGPDVAGKTLTAFAFRMDDTSNTAFSDALVLPLDPSLADFDSSAFFVFFDDVLISGTLDSLEVQGTAVPEPATLTFWGLGALGGIFLQRRRKRAA